MLTKPHPIFVTVCERDNIRLRLRVAGSEPRGYQSLSFALKQYFQGDYCSRGS
jgi:hypothetical protein